MKEVVCIHKGSWYCQATGEEYPGPKFNELLTVAKESEDCYGFVKYGLDNGYYRNYFVEVISSNEIKELLNETAKEEVCL